MSREYKILNYIRSLVRNPNKYLFDDCAVFGNGDNGYCVTTDTVVEGVHFFYNIRANSLLNYSPLEIGWKSLAVNLSDIASMGAKPLYVLVALSVPKQCSDNFVKNLYLGIVQCAKKYNAQIIGGNITSSKELSITITVIGQNQKIIAKRKNAKVNDVVFMCGSHGLAGLAYKQLIMGSQKINKKILRKLKMPEPQVREGKRIVSLCKRVAMMDSSDGLGDCLVQISKQSKVKIIVDESEVCLKNKLDSLEMVLYSGEDYGLVGTVSNTDWKKINRIKGVKKIGLVEKGSGAYVRMRNSRLVKIDKMKIFQH